jgi:signal transduction histidine kinase
MQWRAESSSAWLNRRQPDETGCVTKQRSSYSHADFVAAYAKAGPFLAAWRYWAPSSANERAYSGMQIRATQLAYLLAIHLLLLAQLFAPSIDRQLLHAWYGESLGNLALRIALLFYYFTRSPQVVASSRVVPLLPMIGILIAGLHWAWTALLFIEPAWTFATFMTLLMFLLMSIATTTFVPASPVPMVMYWVLMWVPAAIAAWPAAGQGPAATRAMLVLVAVVVLGIWAYLSQVQVRRYVQSADGTESLVAELREKNEELQRLRSEASERLAERSYFFSSASHDFGQRLHAMKLLTHSAMTASSQGQNRCLTALSRAVEDLEGYVRDVLEFARIESRVITPHYSVFHLQDVFQRLALQFESVADQRQVTLRLRTTTAQVETDEGILVRVLENLIGNAIKFTRGGVLVAARPCAGSWRIEVWDQGPGIPPGSLNRIFASFYQERVYADPQQVSVGLGLTIVKRFADGLKYALEVRSREGRGSVFKVLLPARPGHSAAVPSALRHATGSPALSKMAL